MHATHAPSPSRVARATGVGLDAPSLPPPQRDATALVLAALAVAAAATLGALQSVAWHGPDAPAVARALAGALDPGLLREPASASLAQPSESYFGYGRLAIAVYALLWAAAAGAARAWPRPARRAIASLWLLAAAGDVAAYWVSEQAGPELRRVGFWYTELPALLALTVGLTGMGAWALHRRRPAAAWVLALPVCVATTAGLGYLPHGLLLGLGLTLACALIALPTSAVAPARRRSRRRTIAAGTAAALAVLALGALYRPHLEPGPTVVWHDTPAFPGETLRGARLHVFDTGYNRMSWWLVGRERPWRPVPAFVLELADGGLVVFDTGFSDAVAERGEAGLHLPERWVIESRGEPGWTLPAQMRAAGLAPESVSGVVVSHLHGDHVGQLDAFAGARIVGGPGSLAYARSHGLEERWTEVAFDAATPFGPFDATVPAPDVIAEGSGAVLVHDGGHAREGLLLLLPLDAGPLLLAGDAAVHGDWLESNDVQRIAVDGARAAAVRSQVRAFARLVPNATIAYGHDLRGVDCARPDVVCHAPERFAPEALDDPRPR